jgi:predicted MFS family arabinose efflux permease
VRSQRLLQAAAFCSSFDRMAIAPLLVTMAAGFGVSLSQVTLAATLYFLLYGASQPFWGIGTDRYGRVRVMRLTLIGAAIASAASALAPTLALLIVARALAGLFFGATIPTALVYLGDTVPIARRQSALADLMAFSASGLAAATAIGGVAVGVVGWRVVFVLPAIAALLLVYALRVVPEPAREPRGPALAAVWSLLRRPWPLVVLALVVVEGMVALGYLTFLAPSLEESGLSAAGAGLIIGVYGVATVAWTRLVKRWTERIPASRLIAIGSSMFGIGYLAATIEPGLAGVGIAALLNAGGFAFMHSTLQTWATHVAPDLRATMISLFAAGLFMGGSAATALVAPLAGDGRFSTVFAIATITCVPLGLAATFARRRFDRVAP